MSILFRRAARWALLGVALLFASGVGLTGSLDLSSDVLAQTQGAVPGKSLGTTSDSELWRRLRGGESFKLTHPSLGTGVLVQSQGEDWRALRNGPISTYGGYFIVAMMIAIIAFFAFRGRVKTENPTGRMVERFDMLSRITHWAVAILFVLLAVSGVVILYGKYILAPVLGASTFAAIASASLQAHNLLGPLFAIAIFFMFFVYVKDNIASLRDLEWITKGGILFRHGVPSGKFNFGEKTWFWISMIGGLALAVSGLYLVMPGILEGSRETQQLANIVHGIAAVVCIGASIGHIYLGTIGMDGAFDGMITGEVDEAWAQEHHSDWAEEVMDQSREAPSGRASKASPAE